MKIIDKVTNEEVATIATNRSYTLEEAIAQIGELIDTEGADVPNVIIYGERYYLDDLDIEG